jgi:UDP-glucuronate 4-epimerase
MKVLVTGTAGFIGNNVALRLLARGDTVIGIDNLNDYYDVQLKKDRLARLTSHERFTDLRLNLEDREGIIAAFKQYQPDRVINLAAQAGVRYSLENPYAYIDANVLGFLNILEGCRHYPVEHLVYASTSSVYGGNTNMPFSVHGNCDHPLTLYAATKKANELMAHNYSHLFNIATTGLRFFTVYGPWGRPDMALFMFTKDILAGKPINVFNYGNHTRDFTYVDDIAQGVIAALDKPATPDSNYDSNHPDPATAHAPYRIYNIGSNSPVKLMRYIELLEESLGKKAELNLLPLQPGDVPDTYANVDDLIREVGYKPDTPVEVGVKNFVLSRVLQGVKDRKQLQTNKKGANQSAFFRFSSTTRSTGGGVKIHVFVDKIGGFNKAINAATIETTTLEFIRHHTTIFCLCQQRIRKLDFAAFTRLGISENFKNIRRKNITTDNCHCGRCIFRLGFFNHIIDTV